MASRYLTPESDSDSSLELIPELQDHEGSIRMPNYLDTWLAIPSSSPPSLCGIESSSQESSQELPQLNDSDGVHENNLKRGRSSSDRSATGSSASRSSPEKKKPKCEDESDTAEQEANGEVKSNEVAAEQQEDKTSDDEVAGGEPEEESSADEAEGEAKK